MKAKKTIIKPICAFSFVILLFASGCGDNHNSNSESKIHNPEGTSEFIRIVDENKRNDG
jgi:hypothetical protein